MRKRQRYKRVDKYGGEHYWQIQSKHRVMPKITLVPLNLDTSQINLRFVYIKIF